MSTRAQIRFATREDGVTFSQKTEKFHAQFYKHSDGYPDGLGIEIAESLLDSQKVFNWEIEYLDTRHGDLDYIYYIWQTPGKTTWISIFKRNWEVGDFECVFVSEPQKLLDKYKHTAINTEYEKLLNKYKHDTNTNG